MILSIKNGGNRIWHKDGDENNNWYKNLLYVNNQQYRDLKSGKVKWQDLNIHQEYIEYENKASHNAYSVYNGIRSRCKGRTTEKIIMLAMTMLLCVRNG